MSVNIEKIDFGKTDGKSEAEKANFLDLFYDDKNYFEQLNSDNRFIIYGYKGTGKTMLANVFSKRKELEKATTKKLYASDFIQEKLLSFSKTDIAKEELIVFWKYVYLKEFANLIIKDLESRWYILFKKRRLKKISKINELVNEVQMIIDNSEEFQEEFNEASVGGKLSKSPNLTSSMTSAMTDNQRLKKVRASYIDIINDLEKEVFKVMPDNKEYYVIYDDMDQLEESMTSDSFINLMKQMVYAADYLNDLFRQNSKKCRVIHVIRTDILNMLQGDSNNLIKTVTDYGVEIDWYSESKKNPENHPLMKMILHKAKNTVEDFKNVDNKELYDTIFDRNEPILNFILERSFGRPREIIQFLVEVQKKNGDAEQINLSLLKDSMGEYSKWFYDSMISEVNINPMKKEIKQTLELIKIRGSKNITHKKLINFFNSQQGLVLPSNLLEVLKEMYELGIIVIVNKNGTTEIFYRKNAPQTCNEHTKFVVHYGFLHYLNMR